MSKYTELEHCIKETIRYTEAIEQNRQVILNLQAYRNQEKDKMRKLLAEALNDETLEDRA